MSKDWSANEKILLFRLRNKEEKTWRDIGDSLGVTSDSARNAYRYTNWKKFFKDQCISEKDVLSEDLQKDLKNLVKEKTLEEQIQEKIDTHKEKILKDAELKKHNEYLRKMAAQDLIIEKITGAVESIPPITIDDIIIPKTEDTLTKPQDAVLILSDIHLGEAVSKEEVGGFNHFNTEICINRIHGLGEKVVRITNHHRKNCKIDTLHIFALGDNVHGSNDAGQWGCLHTERNIIEQVLILWNEVEKMVLMLAQNFKHIHFYGVYGNHGRVARRGVEKGYVNWDYILYKIMEKTLANQNNITFHVPRSPFQIAMVQNKKFLLTHGDCVRGWAGIPFYGMMRAESKLRSLFDRRKTIDGIWDEIEKKDPKDDKELIQLAFNYCNSFDYMVMGHFHSLAELETPSGGRIIMNSSFAGGDDYSINSLLVANSAAQKFFGVHPEGKSWTYDIDLTRE